MRRDPEPTSKGRDDLHWLALQLFRGLGSAELPAVRAHGLSLWGYEVLTRLIERPADSQLELADELGLDKSKVMRVLDELESAGYAAREAGRDDRRKRSIVATGKGRVARAATAVELRRIEDVLFDQLPPADRAATRRGLQQLVAALTAQE